MEQEQERICKAPNLKLGHRYSLSGKVKPAYAFIVTEIDDTHVTIKWGDGAQGAIHLKETTIDFYEFPFSSLEKELL